MKTLVLAANTSWNLVNFRAPIIRGLQEQGFRIVAAVPVDQSTPQLREMGVEIAPVRIDARGLSPLNDVRLLLQYNDLLGRIAPTAFLGFTAKPNIYGAIAASWRGVPVINTISGLGTGFLTGRTLQGIVSMLYRWGLRRSRRVFFHNPEDRDLFLAEGLVKPGQAEIVAGSGVDLDRFSPIRSRNGKDTLTFLFIGRLLRDKGAAEFAEAAALVKEQRPARFRMIGALDDHPKAVSRGAVEKWVRDGTVELLPTTDDVRPFIADADCVVLPSYREGLPRVLLEASAMAKPVIASDVPGCRQAVDDGVTGFLCEARSAESLAQTIMAMMDSSTEDRTAMGKRARQKAQREFSQERVVAAYVDALEEIEAE